MRISKIRLAGFKSFVDPTHLDLPKNLTGIVGPNGCGKSNIIDAMLWVLGESSAKHLRGDSMADVIFNGSNTRKPVGQASVEIVFDNSDGTLTGQYANYSEVSVKRQLGRDGLSIYFLNSARCRRKDIIDVFLGTGVGKGGYSVIEQGMISRVIEARPDEMRGFLEEAAGISKYKERRRETETRMRHTRENLDRLHDIRSELERQLDHLSRQVRSAERYQSLKSEERLTHAQLLAIRWRDIDLQRVQSTQLMTERLTRLDDAIADLRNVESTINAHRQSHIAASDEFNQIQSRYYSASAEISRCEQAIQHAVQRREELETALAENTAALGETDRQMSQDQSREQQLQSDIKTIQLEFETAKARELECVTRQNESEQTMRAWQMAWDRFVAESNELTRTEHVEQMRAEHIQEDIEEASSRLRALRIEHTELRPQELETKVNDAITAVNAVETRLGDARRNQDAKQRRLSELLSLMTQTSDGLDQTRTEFQSLRGRISSLQQLQDVALGRDRVEVEGWLEENDLRDVRRLAEDVRISSGWERAVETVLRLPLDTLCGSQVERRLIDSGNHLVSARHVAALSDRPVAGHERPAFNAELLLDKVDTPWPVASLLAGVYAVETREEALEMRVQLAPHESIIARDGTWFGPNWIQIAPDASAANGILERERILQNLVQQADGLEQRIKEQRVIQENQHQARIDIETELSDDARTIQTLQQDAVSRRAELARVEAQLEQARSRLQSIETEIADLEDASESDNAEMDRLRTSLVNTRNQIEIHDQTRKDLTENRSVTQQQLESGRKDLDTARVHAHELELRMENANTQFASVHEALNRNTALRTQLVARGADLRSSLLAANEPKNDIRQQLEHALGQRQQIEAELAAGRRSIEELENALRLTDQEHIKLTQIVDERRETMEQARLEVRSMEVRAADLAEQIAADGHKLEELLANLAEQATVEEYSERLASLDRRISRLGPINLAAIEEHAQASERKSFLDRQLKDLTDALETLTEAIKKIDRETRTRFKETFDSVNAEMQLLFPTLFGGGHAYLEMTDNDLLETGVTVMARPPGKKNSTIHLLSGGEKALTALAFVFSLFKLNPAPFCLLDEVDAPLDDANVLRFCQLVSKMAEEIQFMVITHNKITMEIAEQLIGVTMQEPGVSRLVSVNMDEAIEMAVSA